MSLLQILMIIIWLAGTCWRIHQHIHFYQLEEYKSGRYLRWLFARRDRWLPRRPVVVWLVSAAAGFVLSEVPGGSLLGIIGIIAALIAVQPARSHEVKKPFRPTPRARRMLGAAFALAIFDTALYLLILSALPLPDMPALRYGALSFAGLFLYLTAPFILIGGNWLMTPLEAFFRRRFIQQARRVLQDVNPVVVGITGSYGKTTTKNFVAEILNGRFRAYPTPKSYNTLMGVCLAINNDIRDNYSIDYFICEMGAYVPGEIRGICDLTHPRISIVVEVGPQHLERFGSLENVTAAKYEIIRALPEDGLGVFNWDNPHVREMYQRGYPRTRIAVSKTVSPGAVPGAGPRFIASDIQESLSGLSFTVTDTHTGESLPFTTSVLGEHNVTNILLAAAVAVHEGMPLKDVAFQVRKLHPAESRLVRQVTAAGITIINDAYSANPVGAVAALKVLGMHTSGKRLLITPGMIELGELMESENRKLGEAAARYATDIILIGEQQTRPIKAGLLDANFPADRLRVMNSLAESVAWYQANLGTGDAVLFLNDLPDTYS